MIDRKGTIKISNTASIGNMDGVSGKVGAFIGQNMKDNDVPRGTIELFLNNMFNFDAVLITNGEEWTLPEEIAGSTALPIGKSSTALKQAATYSGIGWDFANVWSIEEGAKYPVLRGMSSSVVESKEELNKYVVTVSDNNLYISGIQSTAEVAVYNMNGGTVSQTIEADNAMLPLSVKGIYVVRIVEEGAATLVKVIN